MKDLKKKNTAKPNEWALRHYGGVGGIKKADEFLDKVAQAMVDNLNKETVKDK